MNARIFVTATLFSTMAGVLTARAADPQMLSLVMPDAKVIAGVNVDSAKSSSFGIYVIAQLQANAAALQQMITLTGFDPARDLHEVLAATNGSNTNTTGTANGAGSPNHVPNGLAMARGNFDIAKLTALAALASAPSETYGGVTIMEDPNHLGGVAFLDSTLVIAGDLTDVKAAIDRRTAPQPLPAAVVNQVNQWSGAQDAWVVVTTAPSSLHPAGAFPALPGLGGNAQGVFQKIVGAAAGLKFGTNVAVSVQATADNGTDATTMSNALQLLVNIAQMQNGSKPDANLTALLQSLQISAQGAVVNVGITLPAAQLQQVFSHTAGTQAAHPGVIRKK